MAGRRLDRPARRLPNVMHGLEDQNQAGDEYYYQANCDQAQYDPPPDDRYGCENNDEWFQGLEASSASLGKRHLIFLADPEIAARTWAKRTIESGPHPCTIGRITGPSRSDSVPVLGTVDAQPSTVLLF